MRKTIETDRLTLRPLHPSDAGPMTLWCSQFRVASMLARVPHPYPPGAAEAFIARVTAAGSDETVWAIDGSRSGAADFLGVVGVQHARGATPARFGYWIGPPAWGLGYATEAAAAALDAAFADAALTAVEASVTHDNPASRRVLDKLGFRAVEEIGEFCFARGETVRATRLGLDRADWLALERPFATEAGE
jgi:RimJ/RimL family protein N-acetyltransferase